MKKVLFLMAVAIAAFTSCQNEQSQLDFADVQGKAVVQGYVYIDKGYIQDGENYVVKSLPAEGCAVLVKVPYTKYDADAAAGDKFFEGVCDANGFYKIEVPVGQTAITGVNVYTRPIVDKYYDLVNGAIVEKDASYGEASAAIVLERGKIYTAANICIQKEVESPILTRNQTIAINGLIQEEYEEEENEYGSFSAIKGKRNVSSKVNLVLTFTNSNYDNEKIVYNITTDYSGKYQVSANLYDVWNIADTRVTVETKPYLASVKHYYEEYTAWGWEKRNQSVTGYYADKSVSKYLTAGSLLIGTKMNDIVLKFVPDYNNNKIYGIGNSELDYINGSRAYRCYWNPLGWSY